MTSFLDFNTDASSEFDWETNRRRHTNSDVYKCVLVYRGGLTAELECVSSSALLPFHPTIETATQ